MIKSENIVGFGLCLICEHNLKVGVYDKALCQIQ